MRTWLSRWQPLWGMALSILAIAFVGFYVFGQAPAGLAMIGAQRLGAPASTHRSIQWPRINVLEVDVWRHSLEDASLHPIIGIPIVPRTLICPTDFSPNVYQEEIHRLENSYSRQRDVLMYFGGFPSSVHRHGLNFNAWSLEDLRALGAAGSRPFIGLETTDHKALEWMAARLHEAGYGPLNRIYIRICSEPSGSAYGTEDGTANGKKHTAAAYDAYRQRFADASNQIRYLNLRYGLDMYVVFAGTSLEDFKFYLPPMKQFDAIGYDLYITPENKDKVFAQIVDLEQRLPAKPMVIPELGIATAGPGADPRWAADILGEVLMRLGHHPGGVEGVTVFSINVAARLPNKRWSWAWTPMMFQMLQEWQQSPQQWRKEGFHLYDPLTYPVGRDVLFLDEPDLRMIYRKLVPANARGAADFLEVRLMRKRGHWRHRTRIITLR